MTDGDEEEKKDLIKEMIIDVMTLKRKRTLNLKRNLKINLLRKKVNFQNEDKILEIKFPLLRCDFVDPIDQL